MIGTIIGDIIGSPYEGLTKQQKKKHFLFSPNILGLRMTL